MWALLFLIGIATASEEQDKSIIQEADYVEIAKGTTAPFSGYLFTAPAIATIVAKHDEEVKLLRADYDFKLTTAESQQKLNYDLLKLQYDSEVLMYKEMISVRDEQIKRASKKDVLQRWGVYGAFVAGAATSVAIFYSVNHN